VPIAAIYPLTLYKEAIVDVRRGGKVLLDVAGWYGALQRPHLVPVLLVAE
jgi:hypothetical protein